MFAQNAAQWNSWFRSLLGIRYDNYSFNVNSSIPQNSGNVNAGIWTPKASLITPGKVTYVVPPSKLR